MIQVESTKTNAGRQKDEALGLEGANGSGNGNVHCKESGPGYDEWLRGVLIVPAHDVRECPACHCGTLILRFNRAQWDYVERRDVLAFVTLNCWECGRWLSTWEIGTSVWQRRAVRLSNGAELGEW